ncbi:MAG: glycerol-3-phosphate 1-O-acyltransferase PlsY [Tenericutes bacterium]|nr:glycerol-3-phosphate 1-O-acyltransferase PlsY [Mycoplasmatota bacterium]
MFKFVLVIIAYLIGSIPFSYILGKFIKKDDIRKHGSGNLGTTNAYRVFGKVIGTLVLILDTLKGGLVVYLFKNDVIFVNSDLLHPLIYGFAAVLGHVFPIWFKFKGGKGVATSFGLMLGYAPLMALSILPAFIIMVLSTRYVSIASVISTVIAFYVGLAMYFGGEFPHYDLTFVFILFISVILIFWRHKNNFHRIRQGTENKTKFDISTKIKEFRHKV